MDTDDVPPPSVECDGQAIVLNRGYRITLDRIDTPAKLVCWLCHLAEKGWVRPSTLRRVATIAADHGGFEIPWDC